MMEQQHTPAITESTVREIADRFAPLVGKSNEFGAAFDDLIRAGERHGLGAPDIAEQARRVVAIERELSEEGLTAFRAFCEAQRQEQRAVAIAAYQLGGALVAAHEKDQ